MDDDDDDDDSNNNDDADNDDDYDGGGGDDDDHNDDDDDDDDVDDDDVTMMMQPWPLRWQPHRLGLFPVLHELHRHLAVPQVAKQRVEKAWGVATGDQHQPRRSAVKRQVTKGNGDAATDLLVGRW